MPGLLKHVARITQRKVGNRDGERLCQITVRCVRYPPRSSSAQSFSAAQEKLEATRTASGLGGPVSPCFSVLSSCSLALSFTLSLSRSLHVFLVLSRCLTLFPVISHPCLSSSQAMSLSKDGRTSNSFLDLGIDELNKILREVEQDKPETAALVSSSVEGQRARAVKLWNEQVYITSGEFHPLANV